MMAVSPGALASPWCRWRRLSSTGGSSSGHAVRARVRVGARVAGDEVAPGAFGAENHLRLSGIGRGSASAAGDLLSSPGVHPG